ncbi:unnamed protein product [Blepharisma stoltei]|uniref:Uncharacterized protein n=1 Tax=Blepharisma stoltei TaxID=1481888 RepID=A0AAU9JYI1_9CILI|nr:unnamed protein product [Blepharisma stoltei]
MEETKNQEYAKLCKVILSNCSLKHPMGRLPENPWFLNITKNEKVSSLLLQLLFDTNRKSKRFAEKATAIIIAERNELENIQISRASLLQENIDIRVSLNKIKQLPEGETIIKLKVNTAQCRGEPISLSIWLGDEVRNLDVGDEIESQISIKNTAEIKAYKDGELLGVCELFLGSLLEDTHYLRVAGADEFKNNFSRDFNEYSFELEAVLKLSKQDREEILVQHLIQSEEQLNEKQETEDFVDELMRALGVKVNEDGEYETVYKPVRAAPPKEREDYCTCCLL